MTDKAREGKWLRGTMRERGLNGWEDRGWGVKWLGKLREGDIKKGDFGERKEMVRGILKYDWVDSNARRK